MSQKKPKHKIKLYTAIKCDGKALEKIDAALQSLTRKDINYKNEPLKLSVYDIAVKEKHCIAEKSKVMNKTEFHVSLYDREYECDISRAELLSLNKYEVTRCIKDIKSSAYKEIVGMKFKLYKAAHEEYGNFVAIKLEQVNKNVEVYKVNNPHLSIIKGGSNQKDSSKCVEALARINKQYHNNKDDNYYAKINQLTDEISAYLVEVTIPGEIPTILPVGLTSYHNEL
jgi:hypothetical protein